MLENDRNFIAAAVDFSDAGPDHFKPGFAEYRDLALAASRLSAALSSTSTTGETVPANPKGPTPEPNTTGETDAEVERILAMSDEEVLAEADVGDVAWARGFKQGLSTGRKVATHEPTTPGVEALLLAMKTIAEWPITDPTANMDAFNMALVARAAFGTGESEA